MPTKQRPGGRILEAEFVRFRFVRLSREPFMEPIERVQQALAVESDRLAIREIGQTIVIRS